MSRQLFLAIKLTAFLYMSNSKCTGFKLKKKHYRYDVQMSKWSGVFSQMLNETLLTLIKPDILQHQKLDGGRILKVVRNKKSKFFSHRYLIEFYETNRMSHVPHLYDVVNLLR